ncbi:hypothetical protein [Embleya sp. MST-111070]|uniref:hypothetical protein n=1 Tax=Embleya sp. MST-111070 TaxID=3398231 RepID=UPI003F732662
MTSGKTTVGRQLQAGGPDIAYRSFGDVVRRHTPDRGRPATRDELQHTGMRLVAGGWPAFVDALVKDLDPSTTHTLVLDGIRHLAAIHAIQARFPEAHVHSAFLRVDQDVAHTRTLSRGEAPSTREHPVEKELDDVKAHAHVVLSGDLDIPTIVRLLRALLNDERALPQPQHLERRLDQQSPRNTRPTKQ